MTFISKVIQRPVGVLMFFAALMLLGGISFLLLPLDLFPDVSYPAITVTTPLGGYSPLEIEQTLTRPMETSLASLNNLQRLKSYSREGKAELQLEFKVGTVMDFVMQEVRERLQQLQSQFPADTRTPQMVKYDPNAAPVMVISLFGALDPVALRTVGEDILQKNLARTQGVAHIEVSGGGRLEVVIEPDFEQLRSLGLSILSLTEKLKTNNLEVALGALDQGDSRIPLRSMGEFRDLNDIRNLGVLRTPTGSLVYLHQIAKVGFNKQDDEVVSRYQGEPRVMVTVFREYGAHIVEVTAALRQALESMRKVLPYGVKSEIIYDQGEFILKAMARLRDAGLLGGLFAIGVVWLFLRHLSSTLVIVSTLPISVVTTFGFMYLSGISLNLISLAGLTLALGMLVDNAVVVVENIYRYQKSGFAPAAAAARGTQEVVQAITAATLIHLAVFFPIFFLQKKIRLFYQDLCYTVGVALLISLAVALVLVPVMMARFAAPRQQDRGLPRLARWHRRQLLQVLRYRGLWILAALILFGFSLLFLGQLGFEGTTRIDRGEFDLILQTPPATLPALTDKVIQRAEQLLLRHPEIKDISTRIQENAGTLRVRLNDVTKRSLSTRELVEKVRPAIMALPLSHVSFRLEQQSGKENLVTLEVIGPEQDPLISLALEVRQRLSQLPQLRDVVIHLRNPVPEVEIKVDHQRAAYLGLSATDIAQGIRAAITGPLAHRFREQDKEIDIRTRLQPGNRQNLRMLQELTVPQWHDSLSRMIQTPIWPAISLRTQIGTTEVHRINQRQALELTAETIDLDLARAAQLLQPVLAKISPPPGYEIRLGRSFEELAESRQEIIFALILALVLILMILAALFESFRTPLVIISSVPLALVGVVAALWLSGYAISVAVYVGVLALAGIVVNNAIVLVDHINQLRTQGQGYYQAVLQGAQDRLRPILITSVTAILGLLPMALERQEGSQLWSPLAWTVIGGLVSSTLLTLFIVPAIYTVIMTKKSKRFRERA